MGFFSSFCPLSSILPPFHLHSLLAGAPQLSFLFWRFPDGCRSGPLGASPQVFKHHWSRVASALSQTASVPPPSLISTAGIPVLTAAHSTRQPGCGEGWAAPAKRGLSILPSCGVVGGWQLSSVSPWELHLVEETCLAWYPAPFPVAAWILWLVTVRV